MRRQQIYGLLIFLTLLISILQPEFSEFLLPIFYALGIRNNDREVKKEADISDVGFCYSGISSSALKHTLFAGFALSLPYFIDGVLQTYHIPLTQIDSNCFRILPKHASAIFQEIDRRFSKNQIVYLAEQHADIFSIQKGEENGFIEIIIEHIIKKYSEPSTVFVEGPKNFGGLFKSLNATVVWLDHKNYNLGLFQAIILLPEILVVDQLSEQRVRYLASLLESLLDDETSNSWQLVIPSNQQEKEIHDHLINLTKPDTRKKIENFQEYIQSNFISYITKQPKRKTALFYLLQKFISVTAKKCKLAKIPEYRQKQLALVNTYDKALKLFNNQIKKPQIIPTEELIQFREVSEVFTGEFRNLDWIEQFYQQIQSLLAQGHGISNVMVLCGEGHIPGLKPALDKILSELSDGYKKTLR